MSRPRKYNTGLPDYVRIRNGSYLYRDRKLCRVSEGESRMYEALAKAKRLGNLGTIPAAVAAFKLDYIPKLSPTAQKEHARYLDAFAREFDRFEVHQVTAPELVGAIRDLFGQSPHAARAFKSRVHSFFVWAVTIKGLCQVNPAREIRLPKPKAARTKWTDALFWKVHDALDPMKQCYHELSLLVYQRTTDIRRLKRTQIGDGRIRFEPSKVAKHGIVIDVPITPAIQAVLERAAAISKEWGVISPYVIHTRSGQAYTANGIRSAYRRAGGPNPKSLLPYAMQHASQRGATLKQLQAGRGHTSITTTEGYMQVHGVRVSEVMQELPPRVLDK